MSEKQAGIIPLTAEQVAKKLTLVSDQEITVEQVQAIAKAGNLFDDKQCIDMIKYAAFLASEI